MTTTTPPVTAVQKQQAEKRVTLRNLFESQKPELSKLLPRNMNPDRLFRMALTECVKNPDLLSCTAESWALAMQVCAAQGLYPDSGLGYMYLIPRAGKVTAMRGYQGDITLARKSGELLDIYAEAVYEKDTYRVIKGLDRNIVHEPYPGDEDPGPLKAVYAVARLRGGETAWVTLTRRDVERHKKSAQGTDRADSPWKAHEVQMWKKTAIRELFRWLPKASEEMEEIARGDDRPTQTIDASAITIPMEGPKPKLDELTDKLKAQAGGRPCEHPKVTADVLRAVPVDAAWPCPDCGVEIPGTKESAPATPCAHPEVPPSRVAALPAGKSLVCGDCGEELTNPAASPREPGSDDDDPQPTAAAATTKPTAVPGKGRQRTLEE